MSLYQEQINDTKDLVLDNYLILFNHAFGDKRLRVQNKKRSAKPPELIELWRKELKTCEECKVIKFYPRWYYQKFCGNARKKEGCAYKRYLIGMRLGTKHSREVRAKNKRVGLGNYE